MRILFMLISFTLFAGCKLHKKHKEKPDCCGDQNDLPTAKNNETFVLWDSGAVNMNEVVGVSDTVFSNAELASLVADMGLNYAKKFLLDSLGFPPHLGLFNLAGWQNSLPKDSIRVRDIYKLMPYKFEIVILQISGSAMDSVLKAIALKGGAPVSALTMTIYKKEWKTATIAGLPFDSRRSYWLVTTDYLLKGGEFYSMLQHPEITIHTGHFWHQTLIDGIKKETEDLGKVNRRNEPRIVNLKD